MDLKKYITITNDFPKKGISFKDLSPLLYDKDAFKYAVDLMADAIKEYRPDVIVGPEARGFLFGSAVAYALGIGFVMARKKGKLPGETVSVDYELEYGSDSLFIPSGLIKPGSRVCLVDDLLATGGTMYALAKLVRKIGAEPILLLTLMELTSVPRVEGFDELEFKSLLRYEN